MGTRDRSQKSHIFLHARIARARSNIGFGGFEVSSNFSNSDIQSFNEYTFVRTAVSILAVGPIQASNRLQIDGVLALGIAFGETQMVDGDSAGTQTGLAGFQVEPRIRVQLDKPGSRIKPFLTLGYFKLLKSEPGYDSVRIGLGISF